MLQFVVICGKLLHFSDDCIREIIRRWWPHKPKNKAVAGLPAHTKQPEAVLRKLRSSESLLINCAREKTWFI